MKVLIVDDRKSERILLELVLKDEGYEVVSAVDGAEALEKLAAEEFDGIISDILMPVMDGFQFCREVKRNEKWRTLPFIFYSGTYTEEKDAELARDLGADRLIVKPMEPSALIQIIREVFENGRNRGAAPSMPAVEDETAYFKLYNQRLIHRLEEKTTHLEEANQKLLASESRLRAILETEPECVKVIAPDGALLEMNAAGLRMLEAESLSAVRERGLLHLVAPEHREAFSRLNQRVMQGESGTLVFEIVGLKGRRRWLETHAAPLRDEGGEVAALLGVARDITERKQAEEIMLREKIFSSSIIGSLPGLFYVFAQTGKFLCWNKNFEIVSGYSSSELSAMHPADFFDAQDKPLIRARIEEVFQKGRADVEAEFVSKKAQKTPYYFTGRRTILDERYCLIGMGIDISQRKQAEDELKRTSEQLRALSAHLQKVREEERTHIAREVHDELGQALTALKMDTVSLIDAGDPKSLNSKVRSMSALIDETVQTVRRIASELRPGILDDLGIVAALQWQAQEFHKRSGIRCKMTSRLTQFPLNREHATALFRVCQEALTNVARHARATEVEIKLGKKSGAIVLEVRDNGQGITAEEMANPKSLGLMGMRERVLLLGGTLAIGGQPKKKGTKVTVTIPLEKVSSRQ
jgi:PAS domain S-box-containing protein